MHPVHSLRELTESALTEGGRRARLGVIGNPVAHSRSPQMQQAALDALGLPHRYVRLQAELAPGGFEAMAARLAELGFIGANVTVPFKKQAFELAQKSGGADALSTLCGASNTLLRCEGGWCAFNTDGPGFEQAVRELCGRPLGSLKVLILGACGGAGSALAAQCCLSGCPQLTLANRPRPQLAELADTLAPAAPATELHTAAMGSEALPAAMAGAELIVNATSLGLKAGDALPLDPAWLHPGQIVCDIVPQATPLNAAAAERGCLAADGLGMLLWQGAYAFRHWFGELPPIDRMRAALAGASQPPPTPS